MVDLRVERVDGEAGQRDWRYVHNLIIPTDPLSADEVRERAGRHRLDVAYVGDVLVGCMTVRPPEDGTPVATVIARILPEHRERGLGTLLYAHGLAQARELGAERIRTVVLESNPQGLRFALARGFVEVERYLLPGDSVPFIDLEAGLKPAGEDGEDGEDDGGPCFVPDAFEVPAGLAGDGFRLEPLGVEHNEGDLAAWSGSIAHIRATPGFETQCWPPPEGMSAESNLADLEQHVRDFTGRRGFAYAVLEGAGEVIGCLYVYPGKEDPERVHVSSWVRADRAALDAPLHAAVTRWLAEAWPFEAGLIDYAPR